MAKHRPSVPRALRRLLLREAGGKCANPGCSNYRTELHHIAEWAVYESHDSKDMIAICPSCHGAAHHGTLRIDDETLRRWKRIDRDHARRDHLYVESGHSTKLLLGTIAVTGDVGVTVFDLGATTQLGFRVADSDIMLLNLRVSTYSGDEVLRVVASHVSRIEDGGIQYDRRPGKIRVTAAVSDRFLPEWALQRMRAQEPAYAASGELVLLDLEVLEPGLVKVQGVWASDDRVVIVSEERLAFIWPALREPMSMVGAGKDSVLHYNGPITSELFGFGARPPK